MSYRQSNLKKKKKKCNLSSIQGTWVHGTLVHGTWVPFEIFQETRVHGTLVHGTQVPFEIFQGTRVPYWNSIFRKSSFKIGAFY